MQEIGITTSQKPLQRVAVVALGGCLVRVGTYSFRHCGAGSSGRAGSRSYSRRRPHGEPPM